MHTSSLNTQKSMLLAPFVYSYSHFSEIFNTKNSTIEKVGHFVLGFLEVIPFLNYLFAIPDFILATKQNKTQGTGEGELPLQKTDLPEQNLEIAHQEPDLSIAPSVQEPSPEERALQDLGLPPHEQPTQEVLKQAYKNFMNKKPSGQTVAERAEEAMKGPVAYDLLKGLYNYY